MIVLRHKVARCRRRIGTWVRRWRRGTLRVTLGTRILLVLVAVATTSTALSVLMQDSSLSADLRNAARVRLRRAGEIVKQLVDERLTTQSDRYRALASSPQFLANVEAGHQPTLAYFAEQLRPVHDAAAILFLDAEDREIAASGDVGLRAAVLRAAPSSRAAARDRPLTTVVRWHDEPHAVAYIPIRDGTRRRGSLVAVERVRPEERAAWSRLCRANVALGPASSAEQLSFALAPIGDLQLRVEAPFDLEDQALQRSRGNLLAGGMLGLALALAASILLARNLVRPIRAIQSATDRIGAGELGTRLDEGRNDEVGDVARSFNLMLDSLQRNMRDRAVFENQISHLAYHDSLTGLPNRRLLKQRLAAALELARSQTSQIAVMFLDLDRFKNVNDTLGHSAGDSLLLEVASRLHTCIEDVVAPGSRFDGAAMLARLGGDEFTLMVTDIADRDQVAGLADRIIAALSSPFDVTGHEVTVSASLGIAMAPDDAHDAETLLRDSDMAMFHAKTRGGRGYEFYADSMEEIAARRLALENKLRRALENDEFELFFQPKLDLETNQITGMEALLRWRAAGLEVVSPDEFVPLAEETGAIVPIGDWVLRRAVEQCLAWQAEGLPQVRIAVNVSARQMEHRDDFVAKVAELLAETGLEPSLLELEITESSLLKDEEAAVALMHRVRELGVGLSLDDFGTGYSSLSYLRRMPIDTLKIDRSFIQGADGNPADAALVGSIVAMAKVLGLRVVVEGVETRRQRRFLEQLGCDEIQGFLISRAVPAAQAAAMLRRRPRKRRLPAVLRKRRSRALV
ncbi:MAG TPA: EAL domain-containing protein [Planctomycetota bacterium]|nr:EAL domain-containing protein [Planctomycetota bacterium]